MERVALRGRPVAVGIGGSEVEAERNARFDDPVRVELLIRFGEYLDVVVVDGIDLDVLRDGGRLRIERRFERFGHGNGIRSLFFGNERYFIRMRRADRHLVIDARPAAALHLRARVAEIHRHPAFGRIPDGAVLQAVIRIAVAAAVERTIDGDLGFQMRKRKGISGFLIAQHGKRKSCARFLDVHFRHVEIAPLRAVRHITRIFIENGGNKIVERGIVLRRVGASEGIHRFKAEIPLPDCRHLRGTGHGKHVALQIVAVLEGDLAAVLRFNGRRAEIPVVLRGNRFIVLCGVGSRIGHEFFIHHQRNARGRFGGKNDRLRRRCRFLIGKQRGIHQLYGIPIPRRDKIEPIVPRQKRRGAVYVNNGAFGRGGKFGIVLLRLLIPARAGGKCRHTERAADRKAPDAYKTFGFHHLFS